MIPESEYEIAKELEISIHCNAPAVSIEICPGGTNPRQNIESNSMRQFTES